MDAGYASILTNKPANRGRRSLIDSICCVFDSDEEEEQQVDVSRTLNQVRGEIFGSKLEKNDLMLAGNLHDGNFSLVRITQKNFFVDFQQRRMQLHNQRMLRMQTMQLPSFQSYQTDTSPIVMCPPTIMYSLYDKGVRASKEELVDGIPEKVQQYIAKRCYVQGPKVVLNPYCGSGGLSIQIANEEECLAMIAMDEGKTLLMNALHNARIYGVCIDAVNCDYLEMQLQGAVDLVVFSPLYQKSDHFSLLRDAAYDIEQLLTKSLSLTSNIIVVLPGQADIKEITSVFSYMLMKLDSPTYKFEIQLIQIDGVLSYHIVYLGDTSMTQYQNEYEFAAQFLLQDTQAMHLYPQLYQMLQRAGEQAAFRDIMKSLVRSQEKARYQSETLLSTFLHDALYHQLIDRRLIEDFTTRAGNNSIINSSTPRMKDNTQSLVTFNPKSSLSESKKSFYNQPAPPRTRYDFSSFAECPNSLEHPAKDTFPDLVIQEH